MQNRTCTEKHLRHNGSLTLIHICKPLENENRSDPIGFFGECDRKPSVFSPVACRRRSFGTGVPEKASPDHHVHRSQKEQLEDRITPRVAKRHITSQNDQNSAKRRPFSSKNLKNPFRLAWTRTIAFDCRFLPTFSPICQMASVKALCLSTHVD